MEVEMMRTLHCFPKSGSSSLTILLHFTVFLLWSAASSKECLTERVDKKDLFSSQSCCMVIPCRSLFHWRPDTKHFRDNWMNVCLKQGSQTRDQRAACGPRGPFVRPAMLFGNFETITFTFSNALTKRCREIIESKLNDTQCGFRPGRSITDKIFTLQQIFEKSWEYVKDIYACFDELVKAYDGVSSEKLLGVLREYGVDCYLLLAVKSLYPFFLLCVRVGRVKSRPLAGGVGLWQGCVLSRPFSYSTSAMGICSLSRAA